MAELQVLRTEDRDEPRGLNWLANQLAERRKKVVFCSCAMYILN
jgi:hypothetical protein